MKYALLLLVFGVSAMVSQGQTRDTTKLFDLDSVTIYIGIVNKFKVNPEGNISQIGTTKGLDVIINKGTIEVRSRYKGRFLAKFNTAEGVKSIWFISKFVPPPAIKWTHNTTAFFDSDSVTIYIGIVNKFKIKPDEGISQIGTTEGLRVVISTGIIDVRPSYKGRFLVKFKTAEGVKSVLFISKSVPPPAIERRRYPIKPF